MQSGDGPAVDEGIAAEVPVDETESRGPGEEPDRGDGDPARQAPDSRLVSAGLRPEDLLDALPFCIFVMAPDHEVLHWNSGAEELCGTDREDVVGTTDSATAFYQDDRRSKTLADKIVDAPRTAHEEYGVNRNEDVDVIRYEDESTMLNARGDEVPIWFTAQPLFDEDGDLECVVEMVYDRSEQVEREEAIQSLVEEVATTLDAVGSGDLSARAQVPAAAEAVLEDEVVEVVTHVNEMAGTLETLTADIREKVDYVCDLADETAAAMDEADDRTEEQLELLQEVADEMSSFSASMEEIAATADQVSTSAQQAREAAESGQDASASADEATKEIIEAGERVEEEMDELEAQLGEIVEIVEVIEDIAEQTNLLALNANIEAARAGEDGSGFTVVAEEVKSLANETQERTAEIADQIDIIDEQTDTTVEAVADSNRRLEEAGEQIETALQAMDTTAGAIDEAATGVEELARANDDQASRVEEVTATVESAEDLSEEVNDLATRATEVAEEQDEVLQDLNDTAQDLRND